MTFVSAAKELYPRKVSNAVFRNECENGDVKVRFFLFRASDFVFDLNNSCNATIDDAKLKIIKTGTCNSKKLNIKIMTVRSFVC